MKKHPLIMTLLCLPVLLAAQNGKQNIVKANILSPIFNTLNLSWERALSASGSLSIGASYTDFYDFNPTYYNLPDRNRIKGGTLTAEYRVYYTDQVLSGAYIAPFARYMYYERKALHSNEYVYDPVTARYIYMNGMENSRYHSIGVGFTAGYQFTFRNVFSLDLFGGPVYQVLADKQRSFPGTTTELKTSYLSTNISNRFLSGYGLRAGITVGMLF